MCPKFGNSGENNLKKKRKKERKITQIIDDVGMGAVEEEEQGGGTASVQRGQQQRSVSILIQRIDSGLVLQQHSSNVSRRAYININ